MKRIEATARQQVQLGWQLFAGVDELHAVALVLELARYIEFHPAIVLALFYFRRRTEMWSDSERC